MRKIRWELKCFRLSVRPGLHTIAGCALLKAPSSAISTIFVTGRDAKLFLYFLTQLLSYLLGVFFLTETFAYEKYLPYNFILFDLVRNVLLCVDFSYLRTTSTTWKRRNWMADYKLRQRADIYQSTMGIFDFCFVFLEGDRKWKFVFVARMLFVSLFFVCPT